MNTRVFWLLAVWFFAFLSLAEAQPKKIPRIGYLSFSFPAVASVGALRQGLRELGYVEGKNIVIEERYAEGKTERLSELATELVHLKVDVIVAGGTPAAMASKN